MVLVLENELALEVALALAAALGPDFVLALEADFAGTSAVDNEGEILFVV